MTTDGMHCVRGFCRILLSTAAFSPLLLSVSAHAEVSLIEGDGPYDPVTLELEGPLLDEATGPNPFADYRLDLVVSDGAETWTVPGYFAGCEDATVSTCTSGRLWRAHFVPPAAGAYSYTVSFRTGADIVPTGASGDAASDDDGATGSFTVSPTPRNAVRARGLMSYTGEGYYRWTGSGEPFFKFGADAPEGTLSYSDFDDTPNRRDLRSDWGPHIGDFDPETGRAYLWGDGERGRGLLGAINYLHSIGANTMSMLLFNVGGDDQNVVPQVMKVSVEEYDQLEPAEQWDNVHQDRYDLSKLAQWQRALSYADELGINLHFKLFEVENNFLMDGGALGRERKIYFREMLARFNSTLSVHWNMGEENTQSTADVAESTRYIDALDPYDHAIVIHSYPRQKERYRPLLGEGSVLTGLSLQGGTRDFSDMRGDITKWSLHSLLAGRRLVMGYDEQGSWDGGAPVDIDYPVDQLPAEKESVYNDRASYRRDATWNAFTAGGEGMNIYYGDRSGCGDMQCRDHRTRASLYEDGVRAKDFMQEHVGTRALTMIADDTLTPDLTDYVLADHGQTYLIYTHSGEEVILALYGQTGRYSIDWFDPAAGDELQKGSIAEIDGGVPDLNTDVVAINAGAAGTSLGEPPSDETSEWVVLVRRIAE